MKRALIIGTLVALLIPSVMARKPKVRSGKVKESVYTDTRYGFSIKIMDNWKHNIKLDKYNFRLVLVQKNYEIPADYMDAPDYTQVPRISIWVDTTSKSAFQFLDSLLSRSYKSDQNKELRREFDILNDRINEKGNVREKLITRKKKTTTIGGEKAMMWSGRLQYRKDVARSASSSGGKRVIGAYGGGIVAVKHGGHIFMFHLISEYDYFNSNFAQAMEMIRSLKWE